MGIVLTNIREAYTQSELVSMIKKRMDDDKINKEQLYLKYKQYFWSIEEVEIMLEGEVYFNYDIYRFISDFLNIELDEITKMVEDDNEVSARGDLSGEEEFINLLNYLFDQMINHRRMNSTEKFVYDLHLCGHNFICNEKYNVDKCVEFFKEKFNIGNEDIDYPLNLFNIFENERGFFILRFPNQLGISGMTIVKNSANEDEKYICIYVNTSEPIGRQNFTLAHELYHIIFEKSQYQISYIKDRKSDEIEKRAEEFASKLIIPRPLLLKKIYDLKKTVARNLNLNDILKLQQVFNVSFQAIVYIIDYSLKQDEKYNKYYDKIPKPDESFRKLYTSQAYREELCNKTKDKTNLNCVEDIFIKPINFINDLEKSLKKNFITQDEFNMILSFFEE